MAHIELNAKVRDELSTCARKLRTEGTLLSEHQLKQYYETFQERFGPEELKRLDDKTLLERLHNHPNHDSLVFWLEYKNDDVFRTRQFGSILGGSGLKYTIFVSKETGKWMGRSPGTNVPEEISAEKAIEVARTHRDQLLAGVEVLKTLPSKATDADYEHLQTALNSSAPDVADSVWGHKYFSLLFPEILDDYHNADLQRFHLIKLLQLPPNQLGRYVLAGWYVRSGSPT